VEINQDFVISAMQGLCSMRDSILTLKEKIISLDNMLLVDGNESDKPPINNNQSID
jgi:hypothetical protein